MNANHDDEVMIVESPAELAFLTSYRQADEAGKRDMFKVLSAAERGLLPSVEEIDRMTNAERRALIDSLPDAA